MNSFQNLRNKEYQRRASHASYKKQKYIVAITTVI